MIKNTMLIITVVVGVLVILALPQIAQIFRTTELKTNEVKIGNNVFTVEVADSILSRAQGLSGRDSLKNNHGMLFIFESPASYGFWMKDMKFAIDIIWIADDTVVGFVENVPPPTGMGLDGLRQYSPPRPVGKVLEVNAGTVNAKGITVGDTVDMMIK